MLNIRTILSTQKCWRQSDKRQSDKRQSDKQQSDKRQSSKRLQSDKRQADETTQIDYRGYNATGATATVDASNIPTIKKYTAESVR